ncbi:PAQR family membrane homeostasis protein TrhA [Arenibaculum pallidiluteum]|uniref:PAQR family membrane homeostasis protein TrhA n=1 Tax=Arenibaculum pallidiluteum TaxID=2812559 RepID=UPI001F29E2F4|nr:hemolysin III family protein [Arenibaculum pallidiluteum]
MPEGPRGRESRPRAPRPRDPLREELANAVTHGLGAALSIVGLVLLLAAASLQSSPGRVAALVVYGATLVLLYLASTLYHATRDDGRKRFFRLCDHAAIFLLIAGTYTPYALIALDDATGWALFAAVWTIAILGIAFKVVCLDRYEGLSLALYLGMGWLGILALSPLLDRLHQDGLVLLALGGVAYTGGVVFFLWERLPYGHAVWHLFVLAGSAFHFLSIYLYLAQPGSLA